MDMDDFWNVLYILIGADLFFIALLVGLNMCDDIPLGGKIGTSIGILAFMMPITLACIRNMYVIYKDNYPSRSKHIDNVSKEHEFLRNTSSLSTLK